MFEIGTGYLNFENLGHVYSFKGMNQTLNSTFWNGSEAIMINGTNSELFPPLNLLTTNKFEIFVGTICRYSI